MSTFIRIEGFQRYAINKNGIIQDLHARQSIAPARNEDGEPFVRLEADDGTLQAVTIVALLERAFPPHQAQEDPLEVEPEDVEGPPDASQDEVGPAETKPTRPRRRKRPAKPEEE